MIKAFLFLSSKLNYTHNLHPTLQISNPAEFGKSHPFPAQPVTIPIPPVPAQNTATSLSQNLVMSPNPATHFIQAPFIRPAPTAKVAENATVRIAVEKKPDEPKMHKNLTPTDSLPLMSSQQQLQGMDEILFLPIWVTRRNVNFDSCYSYKR